MIERITRIMYSERLKSVLQKYRLYDALRIFYWALYIIFHRTRTFTVEDASATIYVPPFMGSNVAHIHTTSDNIEGKFTKKLFASLSEGDVFYDIGVRSGIYTCLGAAKGCTVHGFEMNSLATYTARKNLERNSGHGVIHPVTVSSQDTEELTSIDGYKAYRNLPAPDVIKIDIEGAEYQAMKGAVKTLKESKPLIFVELHPQKIRDFEGEIEELYTLMEEQGYTISVMDGEYLIGKPD